MFFLYISALFVLFISALFFGFKYKQVEGADYKNKRLRDKHGAGSFTTSVSNFFAKLFWGVLILICIFLGILCFAKMNDIENPKKIDSKESGPPLPAAIQNSNKKLDINNSEEASSVNLTLTLRGSSSPQLHNKNYTDEEIKKLEDKAQYSGDDPIIRMRLGLPPKQ